MPHVFKVALPTPLRQLFDYLADQSVPQNTLIGCRVAVTFGRQEMIGVVVAVASTSEIPANKLRSVNKVIDQQPIIPPDILDLCVWDCDYYHHPLGEVISAALPTQLRQDTPKPSAPKALFWRHTTEGKGLPDNAFRGAKQQQIHRMLLQKIQVPETEFKALGITTATLRSMEQKGVVARFEQKLPLENDVQLFLEEPLQLNAEQEAALKDIQFHKYNACLLDGATGSGKTEVYLQAIGRTLQAGSQALVLVPEIGLTPQTLARFEKRFNVPIVQLHSGVSQKQRTLNWLMAAEGRARIVIGTRLAVFTPMPNLGIIVIDEEHDLSFKQQDSLRYSARDIAAVRAHRRNIPLILGSATPALETLFNAQQQRYQHLHLKQRAGNAAKPQIHCVDMRNEPAENILAASTIAAIAQKLERGEQVIVFINRRGYAPALVCHDCGWSAQCSACDRRLTVHYSNPHLRCHHCDYRRPIPRQCPSCHNKELNIYGKGTERVETLLQSLFPAIEIIRVDQDSMQAKQAMSQLNQKMHEDKPCILVGTQMLAKGHHFPKVTLAVLIDVDQGLYSGDFRGAERMGQLIIQVAGRSGRGEIPGTVLLQSHQPDHPLMQCLLQAGYHSFAENILRERELTSLPPYSYIVLFRAESKRAEIAMEFLQQIKSMAIELCAPSPVHRYLGPMPALIEKRNERFRFQLQITFKQRAPLHKLLNELIVKVSKSALAARTRWSVDVDPLDMS